MWSYLPWFLVRVDVCEEIIVDSSLLSSFKTATIGCFPLWWLKINNQYILSTYSRY